MKKLLSNPYVQGVLVVCGVLLLLSYGRPYLKNVPVLNRL